MNRQGKRLKLPRTKPQTKEQTGEASKTPRELNLGKELKETLSI